jgi:cytochrome P450
VRLPNWVPTPRTRAMKAAVRELDSIIYRIIDEHVKADTDNGDLLSMLLQAQDDEGNPMPIAQVRDETLTLFLAGHETTSNALTWTWYLLSQHPDAAAKLAAEVEAVLGGRAPTLADLPRLKYTEMVIKEAMRLYPPVWILSRETTEAISLGGYGVPKGATVYVCPFITQRDPRFFEQPEAFIPERFADGSIDAGYAYLPFGGGPRVCIGNSFAQMASKIIVASVVQRARLSLEPEQVVKPQRLATLRPKFGLNMRVSRRREESALPAAGEPA